MPHLTPQDGATPRHALRRCFPTCRIPNIQKLPYDQKPYWDVERARIGDTREVPVEIGREWQSGRRTADRSLADGNVHELKFDVPVSQSSWMAAGCCPRRIPIRSLSLVGGKPIRASRASAEWCLNAVNQCWTQKAPRIAVDQLGAARSAYDHAEEVYKKLEAECSR